MAKTDLDFELCYNYSHHAIAFCNIDGTLRFANKKFSSYYNVSHAKGDSLFDAQIHPVVTRLFDKCLSEKKEQSFMFAKKGKNIGLFLEPVIKDKKVYVIKCVSTDISTEVELKESLEENKFILEKMFSNIDFAVFLMDKNGMVEKANASFVAMCKKNTEEDVLGKTPCTNTGSDICQTIKPILTQAYSQQQKIEASFHIKNKEFYEITVIPLTSGTELKVLCIIKDVSAQKALEKESQSHFNDLLSLQKVSKSMNKVMTLKESLKNILDGITHLGYKTASIFYLDIPTELRGLVSTKVPSTVMKQKKIPLKESKLLQEILRKKNIRSIHHTLDKDIHSKDFKDFSTYKTNIFLPLVIEEKVTGILLIQNDTKMHLDNKRLTLLDMFASDTAVCLNRAMLYDEIHQSHKRLEEEAVRLHEKIKDATRELQAKNLMLEKTDTFKTNILSIISHELRTPLTGILGYATLLLSEKLGALEENQKESVHVILNDAERLKRVITEIMNLTSFISGKEELTLEKVQIRSIVESAMYDVRKLAEKKNIAMNIRGDEVHSVVDAEKLKMAMTQLLSNAVTYNKDNGKVDVTLRNNEQFFQIIVKDTGIGIKEKEIEKIFEKFYQIEEHMTRVSSGVGLGLSIVREIVMLHDGDLWVKSVPGKSSTFTLTIPRNIKEKQKQEGYRKTLEELDYLRELSKILHGKYKLQTVLRMIAQGIHTHIGFDRVRLYEFSRDRKSVICRVSVNMENFDGIKMPISEFKPYLEAFEKMDKPRIFVTEENTPAHKYFNQNVGVPIAGVALKIKGKIIGVIAADNKHSGEFISRWQLETLSVFANNAAVAIENARLYSEMEKEVDLRTKEIAQVNKELKREDNLKDEMLSYVSHEMRTPLTSLIGYTDLLLKKNPSKEQQEKMLGIIAEEGRRLKKMIDDLLDISKIESGKLTVHKQAHKIEEIFDDILMIMSPLAQSKGLALETDVKGDYFVHCDKDLIKQALVNLVSNGIKFTEKGSVTLRAFKYGRKVRIDVIDTGIGIKKQDKKKVFKKFVQIQHGLDVPKGTGLGMPITSKIVEAHNSRIDIESEPGKGSRFYFYLPIATYIIHKKEKGTEK